MYLLIHLLFHATPPTYIYTLSLHDALPICTARVVVDGSGDAELNVSDELDVSVEGAADVAYTGDPRVRSEVSDAGDLRRIEPDRKSTRLNSSHLGISYAVFCLKKKKNKTHR